MSRGLPQGLINLLINAQNFKKSLFAKPADAAPAPAPPPAPAPAPTPAPKPYTPTPLVSEGANQSSLQIAKAPEPPAPPPPPQFSPGGVGSSLDSNASGFRRKKSAARMSGLTTKGTGRFKIGGAGQSSSSSGLNIGV
jgi:hypothetical protein